VKGILVIYSFVIDYPKLCSLKQQLFIISQFLWSRKLDVALLGVLWLHLSPLEKESFGLSELEVQLRKDVLLHPNVLGVPTTPSPSLMTC
jgi:hypothetical protein